MLTVEATGTVSGPFSLFLPLARDGLGLTLVTHRPVGEDGYFLLSLSPGREDAPPEPKDVTVVLDVSGSMSGEKIRQAREALLNLLDSLSPQDRFRLIAFSNAVRPFELDWRMARPQFLDQAREWVAGLEADHKLRLEVAQNLGLGAVRSVLLEEDHIHLVVVQIPVQVGTLLDDQVTDPVDLDLIIG